MITLYGFRRIFPEGVGETKDLRIEWALQETGLPYRVHGLDHTAGDLDSPAYSRISPFHQVPVIDDDGVIVAESGAILLYIAEKAGKLIPRASRTATRAPSPVPPGSAPSGFYAERLGVPVANIR